MTPLWVQSNFKLIVNFQLFTVCSLFNSKKKQFEVLYQVHPWISKVCIPNNATWIPNPNGVYFYDAQERNTDQL